MLFVALGLAFILSAAMALAWFVALRTGKSGRIDSIWTFATGIAIVLAATHPTPEAQPLRQGMVALFGVVWMARLGAYMWRRSAHGDDPRYAALKQAWGAGAPRKLFLFLQSQAAASLPLTLAAFVAAHAPHAPPGWGDALGLALFCAGIAGVSLADAQMAAFRADPANRGKIVETGLWAWSRHPNYFFEWLGWLAYPAVALGGLAPSGLLALLAPLGMYWLLVHVSGVPPLEQHLQRSRPDAFAAYAKRVSMFWPRAPRDA